MKKGRVALMDDPATQEISRRIRRSHIERRAGLRLGQRGLGDPPEALSL
jgi:hypothetical protein